MVFKIVLLTVIAVIISVNAKNVTIKWGKVDLVQKLVCIVNDIIKEQKISDINKIVIKTITNELITEQNQSYFDELSYILELMSTLGKDKAGKLSDIEIYELFKLMKIQSMNPHNLKSELFFRHNDPKYLLTLVSRLLIHFWYPFKHTFSVDCVDSECFFFNDEKYPYFTDQLEYSKHGIWVFSLCVMYESLIHEYDNATKDVKEEMLLKQYFVPWNKIQIRNIKQLFSNYDNVIYQDYDNFAKLPGSPTISANWLFICANWIIDLFGLLNKTHLKPKAYHFNMLMESAYRCFEYGNYEDFRNVILLLAQKFMYDKTNLIKIILWNDHWFSSSTTLITFKIGSIRILRKETRVEWCDNIEIATRVEHSKSWQQISSMFS